MKLLAACTPVVKFEAAISEFYRGSLLKMSIPETGKLPVTNILRSAMHLICITGVFFADFCLAVTETDDSKISIVDGQFSSV